MIITEPVSQGTAIQIGHSWNVPTNAWLRSTDGISLNRTPIPAPSEGSIFTIALNSENFGPFSVAVLINSVVVYTASINNIEKGKIFRDLEIPFLENDQIQAKLVSGTAKNIQLVLLLSVEA